MELNNVLYTDFQLYREPVPLTPALLKGQLPYEPRWLKYLLPPAPWYIDI